MTDIGKFIYLQLHTLIKKQQNILLLLFCFPTLFPQNLVHKFSTKVPPRARNRDFYIFAFTTFTQTA